jgi:hypothetical protein
MEIKQADKFPVISRTGRTSAELQMIIDTLVMSGKTGSPFSITNIEAGKKYNSMQQRIRAQAKKLGLDVEIHFDKANSTLYFRVPVSSEIENAKSLNTNTVKAKDIKNVRTSVKTK